MERDLGLFLSIAEIAGVFVGFGALISFAQEQGVEARVQLRGVVTIGLVVLVAALLPVALASYGLGDRALWAGSSAGFLGVIWIALGVLLRVPEQRGFAAGDARAHPVLTLFFWGGLELPIQVFLVLVILGVAPTLAVAFYVSALVLNLFEAAWMLARLVMSR